MENRAFMYTLVNKLFLAISQTVQELPKGNSLLERAIENLSERVFNQFKKDYYPLGEGPVDYAVAWVRVLAKQGFLNERHYDIVEEGKEIRISIFNGSCAYTEYCFQAKNEGILFICPRMTSIKWIISRSTGQPYQLSVEEIDREHICTGTVYLPGN